mgnify:FL=1|jgi:hypothetical protein
MALHEVQLKGYSVRPGNLSLGTYDSYGIEQLHVTLDDTWSGLAIDATFHNTPNDKGVTMLVDADGLVPVPPEACMRASKYATITFRGVQDGVQRISCNLPYVVLDHAQVPGANSTATPSENAQALAQMQALRDGAVDAKSQAEAARDDAARSAVAAKEYETDAGQSATAAKTAQKAAASSASSASTSASTATTQAAAAKSSADAAASSATAAKASEAAAGKSAQGAAASESAAKAAQTAAETAKANADTAASNAAAKATAAAKSAVAAKESETSAGQSATAAANSATAAAGSATAAAGDAKTASDAASGAADAKAAAVAAQKDAAASKAAAANSFAAAKTSEDAAAKSAADADSTANSIKESMTQIAALRKRQNVLVGSETGNPVSCDDAFAAPLCGLSVYGKSTQNGTPTPDAPVPIVSAGDRGSVTVKATGKNLLNIPDESGTARGVTVTAKDGLISISGTATSSGYAKLDIPPFIASGVVILSSSITSPKVKLVSETWSVILSLGAADKMSDMATRIVFIVTQGQTYNLTGVKVQLELGTTATAYSPYREQLLTLPTPTGLPGIPVTSGGNYTDENGQQWICDEVDLERGVQVQRVYKVDVDGENIKFEQSGAYTNLSLRGLPIALHSNGQKTYAISTFTSLPWFHNTVNGSFLYLIAADISGQLNESCKKQLGKVYYALATPIETPLTPAEIAAYKALTAYAPDTVVQASDGAGVKLEYQRDVNIAIKKLEDAIASMTAT